MNGKGFKEGQLVAYVPHHGDRIYECEIGRIKRIDEKNDAAFVWYHQGATCARTHMDHLYPIGNDFCIRDSFNTADEIYEAAKAADMEQDNQLVEVVEFNNKKATIETNGKIMRLLGDLGFDLTYCKTGIQKWTKSIENK